MDNHHNEMLDPDWVPSLLLGHNDVKRQLRRRQAREKTRERAAKLVEEMPQQEAENQARHQVDSADVLLPLDSLHLFVPPLRLMSAALWQVIQRGDVMDYGLLEEFAVTVLEIVPDLLTYRERVQLFMGLRARLVLELCRCEDLAVPETIQPHLTRITSCVFNLGDKDVSFPEVEASVQEFRILVENLLEDSEERNIFFQKVFPEEFGPKYDSALQTLVWKFLSRLEKLIPIPDLKQTALWLGAAPAVLEKCVQSVAHPEPLKKLVQHHKNGQKDCTAEGLSSADDDGTYIFSALSPLALKRHRDARDHLASETSSPSTVEASYVTSELAMRGDLVTGDVLNTAVPDGSSRSVKIKVEDPDEEIASRHKIPVRKPVKKKGAAHGPRTRRQLIVLLHRQDARGVPLLLSESSQTLSPGTGRQQSKKEASRGRRDTNEVGEPSSDLSPQRNAQELSPDVLETEEDAETMDDESLISPVESNSDIVHSQSPVQTSHHQNGSNDPQPDGTECSLKAAKTMHPSIMKTGSQLECVIDHRSQMGCPLCPKINTTYGRTIWRHLDSHIKNAVHFQDWIICRCNMPCRDTGHYHCLYCAKTIMRKEDIVIHLTACQRASDVVPPPCEPSSSETSPPVPSSSLLFTLSSSQEISALPTLPKPPSEPDPPLSALPPSEPDPPLSALPPSEPDPPLSALEDSTASVVSEDHLYTLPPSAPPVTTVVFPSSYVPHLKLVQCPHCSVILYKKNLLVHIQRKHKDITAAYRLKNACADETSGLFPVPEGTHGFCGPVVEPSADGLTAPSQINSVEVERPMTSTEPSLSELVEELGLATTYGLEPMG